LRNLGGETKNNASSLDWSRRASAAQLRSG
jgi:hypothetical protein